MTTYICILLSIWTVLATAFTLCVITAVASLFGVDKQTVAESKAERYVRATEVLAESKDSLVDAYKTVNASKLPMSHR